LDSGVPLFRSSAKALGVIHGSIISDDQRWLAVASVKSTVAWEDGEPRVTSSRHVVTLWDLSSELKQPAWIMGTESPAPPVDESLIRNAVACFDRIVLESGNGPFEVSSPDASRRFKADESGLAVIDVASLQQIARFEIPLRISIVRAVDRSRVLVGDAQGYVW